MSKKYDYAVFIGRMQPPHKSHIDNIRRALGLAERAIIIFGSHRAARNIKNPWTADEREEMVRACLAPDENKRVSFRSVRDYYYNDNNWIANVQEAVNDVIYDTAHLLPKKKEYYRIAMVGRYKDHSSYYLEYFPQWDKELVGNDSSMLNATDVRNLYFQKGIDDSTFTDMTKDWLYKEVIDILLRWRSGTNEHVVSPTYLKLAEEWQFIQDYKSMWAVAPYPVTFSTTDAVCVKAGHVLMVRRKFNPGKGLLALPGGFVKPHLTLLNNALEELKEETRVKVPKDILLRHFKDDKVFDHPNRSLRGRTITHAFYFELPAGGELPNVKGDDDAERALWVPIADLMSREEEVYEDHIHIINYFIGKAR